MNWKFAHITSPFKEAENTFLLESCRPISILSITAKILERQTLSGNNPDKIPKDTFLSATLVKLLTTDAAELAPCQQSPLSCSISPTLKHEQIGKRKLTHSVPELSDISQLLPFQQSELNSSLPVENAARKALKEAEAHCQKPSTMPLRLRYCPLSARELSLI